MRLTPGKLYTFRRNHSVPLFDVIDNCYSVGETSDKVFGVCSEPALLYIGEIKVPNAKKSTYLATNNYFHSFLHDEKIFYLNEFTLTCLKPLNDPHRKIQPF